MGENFLTKEITCSGLESNPVPPDLKAFVLTTKENKQTRLTSNQLEQ